MPLIRNFKVIFLKDRSDFGLVTVVNFGEEALKVTGNGAAVKNIYIYFIKHPCLFVFFVQTATLSRFIFLIQPV